MPPGSACQVEAQAVTSSSQASLPVEPLYARGMHSHCALVQVGLCGAVALAKHSAKPPGRRDAASESDSDNAGTARRRAVQNATKSHFPINCCCLLNFAR